MSAQLSNESRIVARFLARAALTHTHTHTHSLTHSLTRSFFSLSLHHSNQLGYERETVIKALESDAYDFNASTYFLFADRLVSKLKTCLSHLHLACFILV